MTAAPLAGQKRTIALVVHPERPAAAELSKAARVFFESRGHDVIEDNSPEDLLHSVERSDAIDLAISLGGDGTMLRTIELGVASGALVLGINLGNLGYLTQVEPAAMEQAFERLLVGDYSVEERMTLDVLVHHSGEQTRLRAFNEAVVEKIAPGHTIYVQAHIGGRPFLSYAADGILVATPTGSTAYNLSLRGPIISPRMRCLVLTPVSPHMLFDRSLVLDADEHVLLEVLDDRPAVLVVDGSKTVDLVPGDRLEVTASAQSARVVSFGAYDFYEILRAKFGLADR
jgi:NAD+ kinase